MRARAKRPIAVEMPVHPADHLGETTSATGRRRILNRRWVRRRCLTIPLVAIAIFPTDDLAGRGSTVGSAGREPNRRSNQSINGGCSYRRGRTKLLKSIVSYLAPDVELDPDEASLGGQGVTLDALGRQPPSWNSKVESVTSTNNVHGSRDGIQNRELRRPGPATRSTVPDEVPRPIRVADVRVPSNGDGFAWSGSRDRPDVDSIGCLVVELRTRVGLIVALGDYGHVEACRRARRLGGRAQLQRGISADSGRRAARCADQQSHGHPAAERTSTARGTSHGLALTRRPPDECHGFLHQL